MNPLKQIKMQPASPGLGQSTAEFTVSSPAESSYERDVNVERYLKTLIKRSPFVVFAISLDGTIKYADGAALKSLGIRASEGIGKNIFEMYKKTFWFTDALKTVIHDKKQLAVSGAVSNGVVDFWYDTQLIPILDEKNELKEVVGFSMDTTSEKRARERAHQFAEEKIAAMSASMDGIAVIAVDGTIKYVNDSFTSIYNYDDSGALIGRNWKTLFEISEVERLLGTIVPVLSEQRSWRGEAIGLKADGKRFYLEVSLSQVKTKDQTRATVCAIRDITDQKKQSTRRAFVLQAASALSESLDYEITLKNTANFAVRKFASWCVVTLVDEQGEIERVIVGADHDEQSISVLLSDVPFRCSEKYINKRVHLTHQIDKAHEINNAFLKNLFPDENERKRFESLDISAYICVPLLAGTGLLGAITFIKSRKKLNPDESPFYDDEDVAAANEVAGRMALAVQNAKLYRETKEAVRSREDLIASVSHDLKNPLSAIAINAELISRASETSSRANVFKKLSATIRSSADRMTSLIKELLELEKLRGGQFTVVKSDLSARSLVDTALTLIEPLALQKSVSIMRTYPAEDIVINADRERLLQVFSNLLGNALKFTPSGGHIQVCFANLSHEIKFSVRDDGQGIKKEDVSRVFDRYWRSEKSDKLGNGIGLTIARAIVASHGGSIWAESSLGKGSTFSFTIPRE